MTRVARVDIIKKCKFINQGGGLVWESNWQPYREADKGNSRKNLQRFARQIGLNGGINTYAYVGDNPVMFADPLGLHSGYAEQPGNQQISDAEAQVIAFVYGIFLTPVGFVEDYQEGGFYAAIPGIIPEFSEVKKGKKLFKDLMTPDEALRYEKYWTKQRVLVATSADNNNILPHFFQ